MKRLPPLSPPTIAFLIAAVIVFAAAAALPLPVPGLLLLLTVAWASARGGMPAGMASTAIAVAALIVTSTLSGARMLPGTASSEIAYTIGFIFTSYLIGNMRHALDEARMSQRALHAKALNDEASLTRVLESITDGFLTLDANWHVTYVNPRGELLLGKTRDNLLGRYILDAFPESVGSAIHRHMERARTELSTVEMESYYAAANRWFEVRGFPATDGSMTVYFRDITGRKRAHEAVSLQARMLDTVRQPVIAMEPDGVIFYWNQAAEKMLGWRADQVIGRTTVVVTHVDIGPEEAERLLQRLQAGEATSEDVTLRRRDGSTFPAHIDDTPIFDESGTIVGMVRVVTDLSERYAEQQAQKFLAQVGSDLAATLDYDALLAAIGLLAVPTLGDFCIVDRQARAAALLEEGRSALVTRISDGVLRAVATSADELNELRRSGIRSLIVAPLRAGGRLNGTLTVLCSARVYSQADATLVSEFARRVALAIDNAILYDTARVASQAKSDFLAVVSHELRTPLTTVMGYTDLLLAQVSGSLTQQSHTYVERIRGAAWHLLGLIEQILIYTRVEVGREIPNVERVPVDYVLRDAAGLMEPVAAEKGLIFKTALPTESAIINTDLMKLRQILLNLLSNAIKFTDAGEVTLEARLFDDNVQFFVHDTGVGIAEEHLESIFDSFWQVDQSATRRAGGTGLGLSVARKLAHLLGGDITVSSVPGQGTTFTVQLPRSLSEPSVPVLA